MYLLCKLYEFTLTLNIYIYINIHYNYIYTKVFQCELSSVSHFELPT